MQRLILAIQFLTVLPVNKKVELTRDALAGSMAWFPVVGAMQGAVLVVAFYPLSAVLPAPLVAGLLLLILALTNGALHLDGFVDTVDGLAGGNSPDERLRIMRDSAIGVIGTVFLVLLLLLKYLAIRELGGEAAWRIIFLFPIIGRWAMVVMACGSGYARKETDGEDAEGLGAAFSSNSYKTLAKASLVTGVLSIALLGVTALVLMAAIGVLALLFTSYFKKKIGGITGDVFGFQSEISEAAFLIMALALIGY